MNAFLCATCGTQFPPSHEPPESCAICLDERQYVGLDGQQWTTLEELRSGHSNVLEQMEPGIIAIRTQPSFAIGQRAFLAAGVLWDCISLIDDATVAEIRSHGAITAMAISHPHYYTTMRNWSEALGNVPVYIHAADKGHVVDSGNHLRFWEGETLPLSGDLTLIRCGGHFEGGTVLHWSRGDGVLFSGDIIQVVPDRRWVSFMYSYPNLIPLSAPAVRRIVQAVEPFRFDRIYGAFHPMQVMSNGRDAIRRSAERYIAALSRP